MSKQEYTFQKFIPWKEDISDTSRQIRLKTNLIIN